jgi:hypothetical protein
LHDLGVEHQCLRDLVVAIRWRKCAPFVLASATEKILSDGVAPADSVSYDDNPNTIGSFQWSADSTFAYFDNGFSTAQAIYRVHISDQKIEQVADLKNFRRVVTPWNAWFGLTPEGEPLLMHDVGSQEVYALDFEAP